MNDELRDHFDRLLDRELSKLPAHIHALLDETPLVVDDHPTPEMLVKLGLRHPAELCGLYHGLPLTEQSVEVPRQLPESIYLFRLGICRLSGCERAGQRTAELRRQIRITLLHEIGHHFGLTEEDLEDAGYA